MDLDHGPQSNNAKSYEGHSTAIVPMKFMKMIVTSGSQLSMDMDMKASGAYT